MKTLTGKKAIRALDRVAVQLHKGLRKAGKIRRNPSHVLHQPTYRGPGAHGIACEPHVSRRVLKDRPQDFIPAGSPDRVTCKKCRATEAWKHSMWLWRSMSDVPNPRRNPTHYPDPHTPSDTVARTIWSQISLGTKMACGARDALIVDARTLRFRVLSKLNHYVQVHLDPSDTYTVEFFRYKRGSMDRVVLAKFNDIYAENLSDVIYRMVNK